MSGPDVGHEPAAILGHRPSCQTVPGTWCKTCACSVQASELQSQLDTLAQQLDGKTRLLEHLRGQP